ncbi:hypothetical protein [Staphylococcus hominis]|uniref:hypothetical protein n=1 Tax=Staphylococcus hominis TaxID=1290 RepID=UPI002879A0CE|nr:hypothetical protein [Staphylococcus hominis]MDS3837996.1 hypothetical protein [Staphylococcus hominis]
MINLEKQLDTTHSIYEIEDNLMYLQNCISQEKQKSNVNLSKLGKLRYELERQHERYCELYLQKYEINI